MTGVTVVSASTSQQTLQLSDTARTGLTIYNQSASKLYASAKTGFAKGNAPIVIGPMGQWTLPVAYVGALYGLWDVATGQATVMQAT